MSTLLSPGDPQFTSNSSLASSAVFSGATGAAHDAVSDSHASTPRSVAMTAPMPSTPAVPQSASVAVPQQNSAHSLYDVLGISTDATTRQIIVAYHSTLLYVLEDSAKASDSADPGEDEMVRHVELAYRVLSDPVQRALYDRRLLFSTEPAFAIASAGDAAADAPPDSPVDLRTQIEDQISQQLGIDVSFAYGLVIIFTASLCGIWQAAFVIMKLQNYNKWSWDTTYIPLWIWTSIVLIDLAVYFASGTFRSRRRRCRRATNTTGVNGDAGFSADDQSTSASTTMDSRLVRVELRGRELWLENALLVVPVLCYLTASLMAARIVGHNDIRPSVPAGIVFIAECMILISRVYKLRTGDILDNIRFPKPLLRVPKPAACILYVCWFVGPCLRITFAVLSAVKYHQPHDLSWGAVISPLLLLAVVSLVNSFTVQYLCWNYVAKREPVRVVVSVIVSVSTIAALVSALVMISLALEGTIQLQASLAFAPVLATMAVMAIATLSALVALLARKVELPDTTNDRRMHEAYVQAEVVGGVEAYAPHGGFAAHAVGPSAGTAQFYGTPLDSAYNDSRDSA
jgi:hypothetical protein